MEDDLPRSRGDAASQLSCESLDRYSQDELIERIALLEAEVVRTRAHHARAADQRKLAETLFSPGSATGDSG